MNLAEQLRGDKDRQSKVIKIARDNLDNIERMVRNNPNFALLIGLLPDQFKEWMEEQRKRIRDLAR
jgi:lipoate-protein ligase A